MSIETNFYALAKAKEEAKALALKITELESAVIAGMEIAGVDTIVVSEFLRGKLVKGTRISIDEGLLEAAVGPAMWKKVTKLVMDKEKVEAQVVIGGIAPEMLAQVSTEKENKPYILVTGSTPLVPEPSVAGVKPLRKVVAPKKVAP